MPFMCARDRPAGGPQPRCLCSASTSIPTVLSSRAPLQVWQRLGFYKNLKAAARRGQRPPPVVGVLGCMAERLKQRLLESDRLVDLVAGPDAYRCAVVSVVLG